MTRRDLFELTLLGAIWGAAFLFTRIAVPEFGPLALVEVRVAIAALVVGAMVADQTIVLEVLREIDGGHAARAELALDAVAIGKGSMKAIGMNRFPSHTTPSLDRLAEWHVGRLGDDPAQRAAVLARVDPVVLRLRQEKGLLATVNG